MMEDGPHQSMSEEMVGVLSAWCLGWLKLQEEKNFATLDNGASTTSMLDGDCQGQYTQQSSHALVPRESASPTSEAENLSNALKGVWIKHMDDEHEVPRRRGLQKQRSISSLQETGVGSFEHLNGLSLSQLQDMEKMVQDHDSNSCYGSVAPSSDRSLFPSLDWLDTLCI